MAQTPVVLVTGASSGIGRACVEAFLAQGARVIAAARRTDRLEELAAQHDGAVLPILHTPRPDSACSTTSCSTSPCSCSTSP